MDMQKEYARTVKDVNFTAILDGHSYRFVGLPADCNDPRTWAELAGRQAEHVVSSTPTVKGVTKEGRKYKGSAKGKHDGRDVEVTIGKFFGWIPEDTVPAGVAAPGHGRLGEPIANGVGVKD